MAVSASRSVTPIARHYWSPVPSSWQFHCFIQRHRSPAVSSLLWWGQQPWWLHRRRSKYPYVI